MNRQNVIEKILPIAKGLSAREFNLLRDAIIDTCIEFENRTCKSCKHSGLYTMGWMPCVHPENEFHIKEVHDEFGCNKWEQ